MKWDFASVLGTGHVIPLSPLVFRDPRQIPWRDRENEGERLTDNLFLKR